MYSYTASLKLEFPEIGKDTKNNLSFTFFKHSKKKGSYFTVPKRLPKLLFVWLVRNKFPKSASCYSFWVTKNQATVSKHSFLCLSLLMSFCALRKCRFQFNNELAKRTPYPLLTSCSSWIWRESWLPIINYPSLHHFNRNVSNLMFYTSNYRLGNIPQCI